MASDRPRRRRSVFGNFRVQVVLRVLVLAVTLGLSLQALPTLGHPAAPVLLGLFVAWQLWSLVRFVDRTNRDVARFFQAVRHADFSQTFVTGGLGSSFDELKRSFNEVLDSFRATRAEKEEQALYLQMVVQHIGVGLVAFDRQGEVSLINNAAKRLLRVNRLGNVSDLESRGAGLVQTLMTLGPRRKALLRLEEDGEVRQLACFAALFRTGQEEHRLVSLHDIQSELEEQEMEAWQRLIRVLTHEIMNSITPIASLSATAEGLLQQETLAGEDVNDVRTAVHTIHRRSQGLLHFVDAYRDLTRVPAPEFQINPVSDLFERVTQLMGHQFQEAGVELVHAVDPPSLEVTADPGQVEQVLINLLRNACEAAGGRAGARVELKASMDRGRVVIEVADNGPGIVEEAMDRIFIPFFTTRQDGSGIGLSLCRQTMRLHRGTISAKSEPEVRTVFSLRF